MRVKQESLYDSEATLRLVDRVLEDLDVTHHLHSMAGVQCYRTEQLRDEPVELGQPSNSLLRAYWEFQEMLECLRDGQAALQPSSREAIQADDGFDRVSHALAMVDQLRSEEDDPGQQPVHEALRRELLALAAHFRCREAMSNQLHHAVDVLEDLEVRLTQLSRVFDVGPRGLPM